MPRAFKSAYDNALEQRDKAVQDKNALFEKIGKYSENMPEFLKALNTVRQAETSMRMLEESYKEVFGEDLPTGE